MFFPAPELIFSMQAINDIFEKKKKMFNPTYRLKRREKIFYFLTEQCPVTFDGCRKFFQIDVFSISVSN